MEEASHTHSQRKSTGFHEKLSHLPETPQPVGMLSVDFETIASSKGLTTEELLTHFTLEEQLPLEQVTSTEIPPSILSVRKKPNSFHHPTESFCMKVSFDSSRNSHPPPGRILSIPVCKSTHERKTSWGGNLPPCPLPFNHSKHPPEKSPLLPKSEQALRRQSEIEKCLQQAPPSALVSKGSKDDLYLLTSAKIVDSRPNLLIPIPQKTAPESENMDFLLFLADQPPNIRPKHRSRSIADKLCPDAVENAQVFFQENSSSSDFVLKINYHQKILGYLLLTICMLANASQGFVTVGLKESVASIRVCCWRMQSLWVLIIPFFCVDLFRSKKNLQQLFRNSDLFEDFLISTVVYFLSLSSFYLALHMTSMSHAFLLNNIHCLILVIYKWISGQPTGVAEFSGTLIAISGMIITMLGSLQGSPSHSVFTSLAGDFIALLGSFAAAIFIIKGKRVRLAIPLYVYLWPMIFCTCIWMGLLSIFTEGSDLSRSDQGIFGWLTLSRLPVGLYLGGVTGLMGTAGYIVCMKFVPGVAIAIFMMLEPLAGSIMGVIFRVTPMPDIYTLIGGFVLVSGALMVILSTRDSSEEMKVNNYIKEIDPDDESLLVP